MSKSIDGWSALLGAARSALLGACGLGFGMTLAIAQQVQEVPKTPLELGKRPSEETAWIKVCTTDEKTGNKQICLVKHEGLDPKTGAILIAAAVRTIEGSDTQTPRRQRPDRLYAGGAYRRTDQDRRRQAHTVAIFGLSAHELSGSTGVVQGDGRADAEGEADVRRCHERAAKNDGLPDSAQGLQPDLRWSAGQQCRISRGQKSDVAGIPSAPARARQTGGRGAAAKAASSWPASGDASGRPTAVTHGSILYLPSCSSC